MNKIHSMTLSDEQYTALEHATRNTKTDCWFLVYEKTWIDEPYYAVYDLENARDMSWNDALSQLGEAIDGNPVRLSKSEIEALETLYKTVGIEFPEGEWYA